MPAWTTSRAVGGPDPSTTGTLRPGITSSPGRPEPRRALPSRDPAPSPARVHPPTPGGRRRAAARPLTSAAEAPGPDPPAGSARPSVATGGAVLPEAAEGRERAVSGAGRRPGAGPPVPSAGPIAVRFRCSGDPLGPDAETPLVRCCVSCAQPGTRSGASVPAAEPCASRAARKQSPTHKLSIYRIPTQGWATMETPSWISPGLFLLGAQASWGVMSEAL